MVGQSSAERQAEEHQIVQKAEQQGREQKAEITMALKEGAGVICGHCLKS